MDEQLLMSAKVIITEKGLSVSEQYIVNRFSELLSSSLRDFLSDHVQPTQQQDRRVDRP